MTNEGAVGGRVQQRIRAVAAVRAPDLDDENNQEIRNSVVLLVTFTVVGRVKVVV